ncbi:MAG TPA: AraC family transcriptional regulator [Dongiaceae bacterium]|jgi:AraC-like DNA-binding protein|nr:AraC family transcriptional regulator [Dongiaceae bacterium]
MKSKSSPARPPHASVPPATNPRLVALLTELAPHEGFLPSVLPGVKFMRSTRHIPRSPIAYEPGIVIIAQGRKTGYLGGRKIIYDADHYLVLSLPLPFECETEGTPEAPLLGLSINVTPALVTELLLQMEPAAPINSSQPQVMQAAGLDATLADPAVRLLETLRSATEARILGPQIVRELVYRVLRGKLGANLRVLAAPDSHFGQISRVLHRIHTDYARPYDLPTLARDAGMSVSAFHARFKAFTATSPLQYVKNIRLHKARMLMVNEGLNAGSAALQVGYESASQFSREFKRLFGTRPATMAAELRGALVRLT